MDMVGRDMIPSWLYKCRGLGNVVIRILRFLHSAWRMNTIADIYTQTPRRKNNDDEPGSLTSNSWISNGMVGCGMGFIGRESHASSDAAEWVGCN